MSVGGSPAPSSLRLPPCTFSCRIVSIESYTAPPIRDLDVCYSNFRSSPVEKVPLIRIFGATPVGQKACLHVHGVFPYLYIPCTCGDPNDEYLQLVARSIDHALQVSLGSTSKDVQHVFKIILTKGIPFYGYHEKEHLFLKIYLYNPNLVKRLADLLVAGVVLNQQLQPHESHIPFVLQFMIDHHLFGMNHIHLANVKFRISTDSRASPRSPPPAKPPPPLGSPLSPLSPLSLSSSILYHPSQAHWDLDTLPSEKILCVPRVSVCELEADAIGTEILNRHELSLVSEGYPGLASLWEEERLRRQVLGMDTPLSPPPSPGRFSQDWCDIERRLQEELNKVIEERLRPSSGRVSTASPSLEGSCLEETHSTLDNFSMTTDKDVVVDKEMLEKTMDLSQRCSSEAIGECTDEELIELMKDLCQTPQTENLQSQSSQLGPNQLSLPPLSTSQSVGEALLVKMRRSHSVLSSVSLFSSPSPQQHTNHLTHDNRADQVPILEPECDHGPTSNQVPILEPEWCAGTAGNDEKKDLQSRDCADSGSDKHLSPVYSRHVSMASDVLNESSCADSSTDSIFAGASYNSSFASASDDVMDEDDLVTFKVPSSQPSENEVLQQNGRISSSAAGVDDGVCHDSQLAHSHSTLSKEDLSKQLGDLDELNLDLELAMASPLVSHTPLPQVMQELVSEESFSGGEVREELEEVGGASSSPLPCAQPMPEAMDIRETQSTAALWDLEQEWNDSSLHSHSKDTLLKSDKDVQLEYEIPELAFDGCDVSMEEVLALFPGVEQREQGFRELQSSASASGSAKRQLLRLLKEEGESASEEGGRDDGDDDRDSCEEEEVEMSQLMWDDGGGPVGEWTVSALKPGQRPPREKPAVVRRISQLDGSSSPPSAPPQFPSNKETNFAQPPPSRISHFFSPEAAAPDPQTGTSIRTSAGKKRKKRQTLGMRNRRRRNGDVVPVASVQVTPTQDMDIQTTPTPMVQATPTPTVQATPSPTVQATPTPTVQATPTPTVQKEATDLDSQSNHVSLSKKRKERPSLSLKKRCRVTTKPRSPLTLESIRRRDCRVVLERLRITRTLTKKLPLVRSYEKRLKMALELSSKEVTPTAPPSEGSPTLSKESPSPSKKLKMALKLLSKEVMKQSSAPPSKRNPAPFKRSPPPFKRSPAPFKRSPAPSKRNPAPSKRGPALSKRTKKLPPLKKLKIALELLSKEVMKQCSPPAPSSPKTLELSSPKRLKMALELLSKEVMKQCSAPSLDFDPSELVVDESPDSHTPISGDSTPQLSPRQPHHTWNRLKRPIATVSVDLNSSITSVEESPPLTPPLYGSRTPPMDPVTPPTEELGIVLAALPSSPKFQTVVPDEGVVSKEGVVPGLESSFELHFSSSENEWSIDLPEADFILHCSDEDSGADISKSSLGKTNQKVTFHSERTAIATSDTTRQRVPEASQSVVLTPNISPPSPKTLLDSAPGYGIPSAVHTKPFYSNPADVQTSKDVGGRTLKVSSKMPYELEEFEAPCVSADSASPLHMGLHHMRTALGMILNFRCSHKACHAHQDTNPRELSRHCTLEEYRQDMAAHSSFFSKNKTIITPALPPPHPSVLTAAPPPHPSKLNGSPPPHLSKLTAAPPPQVVSLLKPEAREAATNGHTHSPVSSSEKGGADMPEADPGDGQGAEVMWSHERSMELDQSSPAIVTSTPVKAASTVSRESLELEHTSPVETSSVPHFRRETSPVETSSVPHFALLRRETLPVETRGESSVSVPHLTSPVEPRGESSISVPHLTSLRRETSQLEGPTPANSFGFKISPSALQGSHDLHDVQYLTSMSVELHVHTRGSLRPDPEIDPVLAIFYFIHCDWPRPDGASGPNSRLGVIAIDIDNCGFTAFIGRPPNDATPTKGPAATPTKGSAVTPTKGPAAVTPTKGPAATPTKPLRDEAGIPSKSGGYLSQCGLSSEVEVKYVSSEHELLVAMVELVKEVDPDFLIGYELVMSSWGYLIDRAAALDVNLVNDISRVPKPSDSKPPDQSSSPLLLSARRKPFDLRVPGRIVLNVWKFMRPEVALTGYTFENLCFHVLHKRLPLFSPQTLTTWYHQKGKASRYRVLEYYLERCYCNYSLLDKLNLISRTSEFARLYGIEFENVANRGSQYRVESMMLRLVKPASYIAISPSVQQRTRMAAPECIPMVLEPESKFYEDPVLVLDFQSLYPSMVIAYNYCYSTCLGRFQNLSLDEEFKFGTNTLNIPSRVLKRIKNSIHVSPNGVAFVKKVVRKGILPIMLEEILSTRIMVKDSMKKHKGNKLLERLLNARQLGLKLVANTTFGYTAATYLGRMPCIEIADSIVQKGRETLQRAIRLVESTPAWGGRVVYGDTDSLFVVLKGASMQEAFRIGKEISEQVTAQNPKPVKLKFERVYLPCILESKKRYVGFSFESPDQKEPIFDAKGIETVRRDSCPAVGKELMVLELG